MIQFIDDNNYNHYIDKFKYMGIKKIEDFLILNSYELNENGILYVDAKRIIESAKGSVETSDTFVELYNYFANSCSIKALNVLMSGPPLYFTGVLLCVFLNNNVGKYLILLSIHFCFPPFLVSSQSSLKNSTCPNRAALKEL